MSFSISEKGLRVVRGTPQVSEGEGAQTLLPLQHIPFDRFHDGTRNSAMGTRNSQMGPIILPNGTLICQKGPVFPRWDPIWLRGPMFTGRVFGIVPVRS